MSEQLKDLHDRLLAEKPDGAVHDTETCSLCALESATRQGATTDDQPKGGSMSDTKTFTVDELKAAIEAVSEARKSGAKLKADATSPDVTAIVCLIDDMVDELMQALGIPDTDDGPTASAEKDALRKRVSELETQLSHTQTAELQKKLDDAVLEAQTEREKREAVEAEREREKTEAAEAEAAEARKAGRVDKVKEAGLPFSDEYVSDNANRWAEMSDEEFEKCIEDWKQIASKDESSTSIPRVTAMTASRDESVNNNGSALGSLRELKTELVGGGL